MFEISFKDTEIQLFSSSSLIRFDPLKIISYIMLHMICTPGERITKKPQAHENKNYSGQELCGKVSNHLFETSKFSFFVKFLFVILVFYALLS